MEFIYFPLFVTTQFGTLTFRLISLRRSLGTKRMFTELWRGLWIDLWELYLVFPLIFLLMLVIHNLLGLIISFLFYVLTNFLYLCFLTKSSIQVNEFINVSNSQSAWTHNSISVLCFNRFSLFMFINKEFNSSELVHQWLDSKLIAAIIIVQEGSERDDWIELIDFKVENRETK